MKKPFFQALTWLSAGLWMAACAGSEGGPADGSAACEPGTERCQCYPNGTCNDGLECRSDLCVEESGGTSSTGTGGTGASTSSTASSGGDTSSSATGAGASPGSGGEGTTGSGGAGATGSGGQSMTGTGGMSGTGGTTGSSVGGASSSGGAGATGGSSGGTAGSSGNTCEADLQNDPINCGACGRVCRNQDPQFLGRGCDPLNGPCCSEGSCAPAYSDCFIKSDGYSTCAEICETAGEQCLQMGCGVATWSGWNPIDTVCEEFGTNITAGQDPCDTPLPWDDGGGIKVRCCCTDTHP